MGKQDLTYQECPIHDIWIELAKRNKTDLCGCPRTTRTDGLLIYKSQLTGNWVVWDVAGHTWLSLSGSWKTSIDTANLYLWYRKVNPGESWGILANP